MEPFQRFKRMATEENLWVYALSLGVNKEVIVEDLKRDVFEKFNFLPNSNMTLTFVLNKLSSQGYIHKGKFSGRESFTTTPKGVAELEKAKKFVQELLQKM